MENSGYVGAPYNFVPFYKDVVSVEKEQMMTHDKKAKITYQENVQIEDDANMIQYAMAALKEVSQ